jgi:hypothetical protein
MNANFFSISVLEGLRILLINVQKHTSLEEAKKLSRISRPSKSKYDLDSAYDLIMEYGKDYFSVSQDNEIKIHRNNLSKLIKVLRPGWFEKVELGRSFVFDEVEQEKNAVEIFHTFEICKLRYDTDFETIFWWKNLANEFRSSNSNIEKGIDGELLTMSYERDQLQKLDINEFPLLSSLDDETLGYDVISFRKHLNSTKRIYIEAKYSSGMRFFLTRNEWESAENYKDDYFLYFWNEGSRGPRILKYSEVSKYIPKDKKSSRWETLSIRLDN